MARSTTVTLVVVALATLLLHSAIVVMHIHPKQTKDAPEKSSSSSTPSSLSSISLTLMQKLEDETKSRLSAEQALEEELLRRRQKLQQPQQPQQQQQQQQQEEQRPSPAAPSNPSDRPERELSLPVPERLRGYANRYAGVPRRYDRTYLIDRDDDDARKRRRMRAHWGSRGMVLQYDSRFPAEGTYMHAAMVIWRRWANLHGHIAAFYHGDCADCHGTPIAPPWCKVAASIQATVDHPEVAIFLYVDSDSVIAHRFMNVSLMDIVSDLAWQDTHAVVLNQDGPGHWCQVAGMRIKTDAATGKPVESFPHCINSGTFLWRGNHPTARPTARAFLEAWWALGGSGEEDAKVLPFSYDVRHEWPWEQGPGACAILWLPQGLPSYFYVASPNWSLILLCACAAAVLVAKAKFEKSIQVVPHPHISYMHWANRAGIASKHGYKQMPIMP